MKTLVVNKTNDIPSGIFDPNDPYYDPYDPSIVYEGNQIYFVRTEPHDVTCYLTTEDGSELIQLRGNELLHIKTLDDPYLSEYTLEFNDSFHKFIRCENTSDINFIIPADSDVNFKIGTNVLIGKNEDGNITFVPGYGVNIISPESLTITKRNGKVTLIKTGPYRWELEGNLEVLV